MQHQPLKKEFNTRGSAEAYEWKFFSELLDL